MSQEGTGPHSGSAHHPPDLRPCAILPHWTTDCSRHTSSETARAYRCLLGEWMEFPSIPAADGTLGPEHNDSPGLLAVGSRNLLQALCIWRAAASPPQPLTSVPSGCSGLNSLKPLALASVSSSVS